MELREHPLSEGFLKCFKFYLPESAETRFLSRSIETAAFKCCLIKMARE
jgi:hypothetical protein